MRTFAKNLRSLRAAKGIRQSELAKNLSVSRSAVSGWESGNRNPSLEQAVAISQFLGCRLDDLVNPQLSA